MYDKEMFERAATSPFLQFCDSDIIDGEMRAGFEHNVKVIIVEPYQIERLLEIAKEYPNSRTRIGMCNGYPFGAYRTNTKVMWTKFAVEHGVHEMAVGININAVLSGDIETAKKDLAAVVEATEGKVEVIPVSWAVRVPFETLDQICEMYIDLGITTMKTSAGLHYGAMQVEHVQYIQRKFGDKLAIEVAGRCRTRETAEAMRAAGAVCFHMSQWRRICGNGYDYQFDYLTKKGGYMTYRDRDQ